MPEVYLNKAEAQAQLGQDAKAQATVQTLREKRFAAANLTEVTRTGGELVDFIREERRRELCYEGHRWFDLRRYAVNTLRPFTKSITHVHLGFEPTSPTMLTTGTYYNIGEYVLKPYPQDVAAYMLPIPRAAIEFNRGVLTNETRPERAMTVY